MPEQKVGRSAPPETDAERCEEIAGEFYPNGEAGGAESVGPAIEHSERNEHDGRICELGRRLGYNNAKTKMLIGQSAGNLTALERKLLNELDEKPGRIPVGNGDKGHERQHEKASTQSNGTTTSNTTSRVIADGSTLPDDGFLF